MNPEEQNPIPVPVPENKPEEKERVPIKSLRTYQGDVEETLSKNKATTGTIFVAEQKRREALPEVQTKATYSGARDKFFIYLGSVLFILGILAVGTVYYMRTNQKVDIVKQTKALIGFSEEKDINIASSTRSELLKNILSQKQSWNKEVNSVLYLNATDGGKNPLDISRVLTMLAPKMPPSLSRSIENKYMIGIYSFDTNEPFIIFTTKDYASSYEGMLKWEKEMVSDLGGIFEIIPNASTTMVFVDEALHNKDLRVIRNDQNKVVLLYSFIDKNTLVITGSENVFTAIVGKYLISQQNEGK